MLPSGPLDAPQWGTAFATQLPDSGTTGATAFLATLAGAYCIKASSPAEGFANTFNRWLGAPSPQARWVRFDSQEYDEIRSALCQGAKFAHQRGLGYMTRIHGNSFRKSHFLVMSLVPDASMFAVPAALAQQLFEPSVMKASTGVISTWGANTQKAADVCGLPMPPTVAAEVDAEVANAAKVRLQSLGRVLFADLCLQSRDRFLPPPFVSVATVDGVLRKEAGEAPPETTDMRHSGDAGSYL